MIPVTELKARRAALMQQMPPQSLAILPAARLSVRSQDTHYPFRQDSDYWYYTGLAEPDGVLLMTPTSSVLLVLPRDPQDEIWHGRRLGCEQAQALAGVTSCKSTEQLAQVLTEFIAAAQVLYLAEHFIAGLAVDGSVSAAEQIAQTAAPTAWFLPYLVAAQKELPLLGKRFPEQLSNINPLVHNQRLIKSPYEQALLRKACQISAEAHCRAMQFVAAGHYEYQVAAELHHEFVMQGASGPAYGTICGSGDNACILHYTENSSELKDGDLLLIDAGAEYAGYAGDISRTFPVNGRFSPAQRQLYELVLRAQEAALAVLKPGATLPQAYRACTLVLVTGLVELGILTGEVNQLIKELAFRPYFMHGLGHWLGLDVHDPSDYRLHDEPRKLEAGMVLTIEPGLYIPKDAECPEVYRGIGIRIEDNILMTAEGYENLTHAAPKTVAEIEALMNREQDN